MGTLHLSSKKLTALLDGELPAKAETEARQQPLDRRHSPAASSLTVRLERDLRQPPVLSCEAALELLSATFDDQANQPERATAERHLNACEACRGHVQARGRLGYALR